MTCERPTALEYGYAAILFQDDCATVGVQTEIDGAAAELCCTTIRFSCSASIDEVQKMLQWHPPASSL